MVDGQQESQQLHFPYPVHDECLGYVVRAWRGVGIIGTVVVSDSHQ